MRVGLVASPFIPVPPREYGGTELFIADLACALRSIGVEVVVYTNGESTIDVEKKFLFHKSQWPLTENDYAELKEIEHTTWAIKDASAYCDLVHLNSPIGLTASRLSSQLFVYTMHHPADRRLSQTYSRLPEVNYVCISHDQRSRERLPKSTTIHHGVDFSKYTLRTTKEHYLCFIGRIAPIKGTHLAIEIAKRAEIPLKIAGEIQPVYRGYFDSEVKPHIDGKSVEYIGLADLAIKNELLGNSLAMLFPITWNEPFGLVMIEAMACGTPVLALRAGSVPEIVRDGVSGHVARTISGLVKRARNIALSPAAVRAYAEEHFSKERMARDYKTLYRQVLGDCS